MPCTLWVVYCQKTLQNLWIFMLKLRYEYFSESYPRFGVYKIQEWEKIQHHIVHEKFSKIIDTAFEEKQIQHTFLLDESRFSFFRFDIFLEIEDNFSIQKLQEITKEKMEQIELQQGIQWKFLTTYIDSIFVNWEEKKYLIWESWQVFFRLYIIYIDSKTLNTINSSFGKVRENPNIKILPQSFHTTLFLRNSLKRDNFLLLYITESSAKVIKITNSFYESVNVINLWLWALKQMYKDNWVYQYWYKNYNEIQQNVLAENLVVETLEFYSMLFFSRLEEQWCVWNDIFVISPIVKNWHFMEVFNRKYREYTNSYIVPFHYSDNLETFNKEREPDDMDALVYLNREKVDVLFCKKINENGQQDNNEW